MQWVMWLVCSRGVAVVGRRQGFCRDEDVATTRSGCLVKDDEM